MPACCHKPEGITAPVTAGTAPARSPRFSTATQDSKYICFMWLVEYFLTEHRRSRFYLQ